jgi:hypothetical protein
MLVRTRVVRLPSRLDATLQENEQQRSHPQTIRTYDEIDIVKGIWPA